MFSGHVCELQEVKAAFPVYACGCMCVCICVCVCMCVCVSGGGGGGRGVKSVLF